MGQLFGKTTINIVLGFISNLFVSNQPSVVKVLSNLNNFQSLIVLQEAVIYYCNIARQRVRDSTMISLRFICFLENFFQFSENIKSKSNFQGLGLTVVASKNRIYLLDLFIHFFVCSFILYVMLTILLNTHKRYSRKL